MFKLRNKENKNTIGDREEGATMGAGRPPFLSFLSLRIRYGEVIGKKKLEKW